MIKINLLTSYIEGAKDGGGGGLGLSFGGDDEGGQQVGLDFGKRVAVLLIGPIGLFVYESQTIPVLQAKLSEATVKHSELKQFNDSKQNLTLEIKKYETEQARFNAQMDFINKIDNDKVNEYRLFEHLKSSTPSNVWVTKLELIDNNLTIAAESDDPKDIATFIQRLSNAEFISNLVPMNQTSKKNFSNTDVTTTVFTVKAQLNAGAGKSP